PHDHVTPDLVDLAVTWSPDLDGNQGALCARSGLERPAFVWGAVESDEAPPPPSLRIGESVPLARFHLDTAPFADLRIRRVAHTNARGRIASGSVPLALRFDLDLLDLTCEVDTTTARFKTTPVYHATVVARPELRLHGPFVSIDSAAPDGFKATVRYA